MMEVCLQAVFCRVLSDCCGYTGNLLSGASLLALKSGASPALLLSRGCPPRGEFASERQRTLCSKQDEVETVQTCLHRAGWAWVPSALQQCFR